MMVSRPTSRLRGPGEPRQRPVTAPRPTDGVSAALRSVYLCAMDDAGRDFDALLRRLD